MPDGSERPWNGKLPPIDCIVVDRIPIAGDEIALPGQKWNQVEGQAKEITKIAWVGDIETKTSFQKLPPWMIEQCPRYEVIAELKGDR
jgi:hypothetical protein